MKPEDIERLKNLLPTTLGSDEIREQLAADILRRSVFSARMASVPYLAKIREVATAILEGTINQAEARTRLLTMLAQMGHETVGGDAPGAPISDPASERRLNLIIDTQRQMAASVSRIMRQDEGTLAQFPGWELCRVGSRQMPRKDWLHRWNAAGDSVGWEGAVKHPIYGDITAYGFLALKSSPIWQAIGDGSGGFKDTLGNPYPPFAYASGMAWLDADRETCERYGLVGAERSPRPTDDGRGRSPSAPHGRGRSPSAPSLSPSEQDILDAVDTYGFDISEGLL